MKVSKISGPDGTEYRAFTCPGCGDPHVLPVTGARKWGFNFSDDSPTFTPSILAKNHRYVCHSYVTDGRIQFLGDCTHNLAGKTVDLLEVSS